MITPDEHLEHARLRAKSALTEAKVLKAQTAIIATKTGAEIMEALALALCDVIAAHAPAPAPVPAPAVDGSGELLAAAIADRTMLLSTLETIAALVKSSDRYEAQYQFNRIGNLARAAVVAFTPVTSAALDRKP